MPLQETFLVASDFPRRAPRSAKNLFCCAPPPCLLLPRLARENRRNCNESRCVNGGRIFAIWPEGGAEEAPNTKLQAPEKHQAPSSKKHLSAKSRAFVRAVFDSLVLGVWDFFGIWNLELGASLGLGAWRFQARRSPCQIGRASCRERV